MTTLGPTDLEISPLCLGGNVFGWTAIEQDSFAVLDAFADAGGTFVDTADVYSAWVPGHEGGESEAVLGRWMAARGTRDQMVVATKVGMKAGLERLTPETIRTAVLASLERLQTDHVDLYYAHTDDEQTPLAETLGGFDALVREGLVRQVGASNYSAARLAEALATADREGLARYVALQPKYSLVEREFEDELQPLLAREGLSCLPYSSLASGFLTGKYRPGATVDSPRASGVQKYVETREDLLVALEEVAGAHEVPVSAVALAWLSAQATVAAPIASARNPAQLADLLPGAHLVLGHDELERLAAA